MLSCLSLNVVRSRHSGATICKRLLSAVAETTPNPVHEHTEDEAAIQHAVRDYAREVIAPKVAAMDAAGQLDSSVVKGLFEQGFMGLTVSADHGGAHCSFTAACVLVEELARVDPSVATVCEVQNLLVNPFLEANMAGHEGTLVKLATDSLAGVMFSTLAQPQSSPLLAKRVGAAFEVTGAKAWCTGGADASMFLLFANCVESGELLAFMVDRDQLGTQGSFGSHIEKSGLRGASITPVCLQGLRVPATARVGAKGVAAAFVQQATARMAISGAALCTGLAMGAFDGTVPYLHQRRQFGMPVADFQSMQHQRAQVATDMEASRLLAFHAARLYDNGTAYAQAGQWAALNAKAMAQTTASLCIEWLGGVGFTRDFPVEKLYRDSMAVPHRLPLTTVQS